MSNYKVNMFTYMRLTFNQWAYGRAGHILYVSGAQLIAEHIRNKT